MGTNHHVGNIVARVAEEDLTTLFGNVGPLDPVKIPRDCTLSVSHGFAIIAMSRKADAEAAIGRRKSFSARAVQASSVDFAMPNDRGR
jgi:RNA recognition motif-containing protein